MAVYFIQAVAGGAIKVGQSIDPVGRLGEIQNYCPIKLQILSTMPGDSRSEKLLHMQLRKWRMHGEWFAPSPLILALAESHKPEFLSRSERKYPREIIGWCANLRLAYDLRNAMMRTGVRLWQLTKALGPRGTLVSPLIDGDASLGDLSFDDIQTISTVTDTEFDWIFEPFDTLAHCSAAHLRPFQ